MVVVSRFIWLFDERFDWDLPDLFADNDSSNGTSRASRIPISHSSDPLTERCIRSTAGLGSYLDQLVESPDSCERTLVQDVALSKEVRHEHR